jgi:hypothetical protein
MIARMLIGMANRLSLGLRFTAFVQAKSKIEIHEIEIKNGANLRLSFSGLD